MKTSDPWPQKRLGESIEQFHNNYRRLQAPQVDGQRGEPFLDIGSTYRMFIPRPNGQRLPSQAWWDATDALLQALAKESYGTILEAPRDSNTAKPLAGAIARYEPVLKKVPHYYFPGPEAWNTSVMGTSTHTIEEHILTLQDMAVEDSFDRLPEEGEPKNGAGLTVLLEMMAVYREKAKDWIDPAKGALVVERTLVVNDLKTCTYVSEEGRGWYQPQRGCLLVPFVAHDGRLVGHGLVVYDCSLTYEVLGKEGLEQLVRSWQVLFDATFSPLVANLNSAALSALDGFFLGRVRELRHRLVSNTQPGQEDGLQLANRKSLLPARDHFVLNKIALYELLQSRIIPDESRTWRVVFFDLDDFKEVNKKIGHQLADVLLFHVAQELGNTVFRPREDRWLCRFGGDEFVGIVPEDNTSPRELSPLIAAAIARAQENYNTEHSGEPWAPLDDDGKQLPLTTSMGWVTSRDLAQLEAAGGLDEARKRLLRSMRESYALLELADMDIQEHVKGLGKYGWLEFAKRKDLPADICRHLSMWIDEIRWLGGSPPRKRKVRMQLEFTPDQEA